MGGQLGLTGRIRKEIKLSSPNIPRVLVPKGIQNFTPVAIWNPSMALVANVACRDNMTKNLCLHLFECNESSQQGIKNLKVSPEYLNGFRVPACVDAPVNLVGGLVAILVPIV